MHGKTPTTTTFFLITCKLSLYLHHFIFLDMHENILKTSYCGNLKTTLRSLFPHEVAKCWGSTNVWSDGWKPSHISESDCT